MTTLRFWIYGAIVALLVLLSLGIYEYHHGLVVGKQQTLIAHDDSAHKADNARTSRDSLRIKEQADSLKAVLMERDSLAKQAQKAQRQRDTAQAFAKAERKDFTLKGDTAVINGQSYVLPVTVSTYVRLSDTAFAKQGQLDAIEAQADSNSSRTIARLETLSASKDSLIMDLKVTINDQSGEIKDLKAQTSPRFGFKSGLALGIAIVATLVHFIK